MRKLINFIAFQIGWFAAVLGAAHGMPWLAVVVVPLTLAVHLALSPYWRSEFFLALAAAIMGFLFDTALVSAGVFSPVFYLLPSPFSPPWMVMLWVNFATTLNVSLGGLRGKYTLAAILGAIGGPIAYYSGAKLGAMTAIPAATELIILALVWAAAVPALFLIAAHITQQFKV